MSSEVDLVISVVDLAMVAEDNKIERQTTKNDCHKKTRLPDRNPVRELEKRLVLTNFRFTNWNPG